MAFGDTLQASVEAVPDEDLISGIANKQQQKTDAASQAYGPPTPEPTPEPDVGHNNLNKQDQQAGRKQQTKNTPRFTLHTKTPAPTPEPDIGHNDLNKQHQQAGREQQTTDTAKPAPSTATSEPTSEPGLAHSKAQHQTADPKSTAHSDQSDAPSAQSKPAFDGSSVPTSPNVTESQSKEKQKPQYSAKDEEVVDRIMKCDSKDYHQILNVSKGCTVEEATAAYNSSSSLLNPNTNHHPGAQGALKKLRDAATRLSVPLEEFSGNADGDDTESIGTNEAEAIDPKDNPPPPNDFCKSIYTQAEPYLEKLMETPDDADAIDALDSFNEQIKKNNIENMHSGHSDDFFIKYSLFKGNFKLARKPLDTLKEDPQNGEALKKIEQINEVLTAINKRYGYPEAWIIAIPNVRAKSKASPESEQDHNTKDVTDTKTATWRPGLTRKGEPILAYRTIGGDGHGNPRGYQFVIQTGTKDNPLYDLRSGGEIGRKAADGYRNMGKDKTVRLGEADKKYSRKDADVFQEILGVASKPIETKTIGTGFQYPVASIYIRCTKTTKDGVKEWRDFVFRQTLRKMLGKTDADEEINEYYEARNLRPPWKVAHTKTRLPKKARKHQNAAAKDTLSSEEVTEYEPSESSESEASKIESAEDEELENETVKNQEIDKLKGEIAEMKSEQNKTNQLLMQLLSKQK